ncbi:MAG: ATP-binding protein [Prevotella sp.]|nr:ATP-binding protein [Prevotella sp.]
MAVIEQNSAPFRPYARLMNLLGDQLITDKIIAVIELLKNCYDADSPSAEVRFSNTCNMGLKYLSDKEMSYIEIKDNGCGMTLQTIKDVWMCPATPNKYDKKKRKESYTPKGRVIQGEKGIGRFAIHKLGEKIELYTKSKGENEVKLVMDFSEYDPEDINLFNSEKVLAHKLLEDVQNTWYVNSPAEEILRDSGTTIKIYNLREKWSKNDFDNLYKNIQRLMPPIDRNAASLGIEVKRDFDVQMYVDGKIFKSDEIITFDDVIDRAQYFIIGSINEEGIIDFEYTSKNPQRCLKRKFNLLNKEERSEYHYDLKGIKIAEDKEKLGCGPFAFSFYAFDLRKPDKTLLNEDLTKFIKDNFVYVLRDGVRVYPYGEKGIDWLNLDKLRSTVKAGYFVSYNDLTGFVYISQEKNHLLKDASNRQGIVNINGAYDDFTKMVTAVTQVFNTEMKIDKAKNEIAKKKLSVLSKKALTDSFDELKESLARIDDKNTVKTAKKFVNTYTNYLATMEDKVVVVEDLAGLGMAVEKSSHDSLRLLLLMRENVRDTILKLKVDSIKNDELITFLKDLEERLAIVYDDMQLIQPLFKIQRKAIKKVSILNCIKKVTRYFRYEIDGKIETNVMSIKDDFIVMTNIGLILQVIINLVDNAVYWLNAKGAQDKEMFFKLNPKERTLVVADNGNGVRDDIVELIFHEFVSMKSEGRGLGLYIARELLTRINAEISVIEDDRNKVLPGANFIIKFNGEEA